MKKERQSNIELLKIVSAIGVVVLHYNNPTIGQAFQHVSFYSTKGFVLYFLECAFISAVDVFMLISGYFMAKSKRIDLKKPVRLLIQVCVFRLLEYLLKVVLEAETFRLQTMLSQLLPASYFVVLYIAVYLVSPFVNLVMNALNRKGLRVFLAIAVLLICVWPYSVDLMEGISKSSFSGLSTIGMEGSQQGYTFLNFLLMYMIGAYLRITDLRWKTWVSASVLLVSWMIQYVFLVCLLKGGVKTSLVLEYCNPLVVLGAVSQFLLFKNLRIPSNKMINSMAKASFSVYLLNSVLLVLFVNTEKFVSSSGLVMVIHMAITCLLIFIVCWLIQLAYDCVTTPVYAFIDKHTKRNTIISIDDCMKNEA